MTHAPSSLKERLSALSPAVLKSLRRGIEKESLRVRPDGALALTPHPAVLGSALKHPHITTDFGEALIELITGVHTGVDACLDELKRIHQFVYRHIGDEVLWGASMPCSLPDESSIPIARYGDSNVGRAKTVYRMGLSHRYGRRMQMIAGLHYNFSLPETAWPLPGLPGPSEGYFALIRNFRRHAWLLMYLFGASPAVCASFVEGRKHELRELAPGTHYMPHATSLRMGRLGYLSEAQDSLLVSYNSLESYTASLYDALTQPYPPYEAIGIRDGVRVTSDGVESYRQLATSLLQIENEFYSTIRPKRVIRPGERALHALRERGVEYVEVRAMDLDPFAPIGITASTVRFLDIFLLHCLLTESPPDARREIEAIGRNKQRAAQRGREPGLRLERGSGTVELREWGAQVLAECEPVAQALDSTHRGGHEKSAYRDALAAAVTAVEDPAPVPSARVLSEIQQSHGGSYARFALARSLEHARTLRNEPLSSEVEARFVRLAEESVRKQKEIEAADKIPFETYRQKYLSHESLRV
ncbi:MAG TPA: glutamate--cysteine ligase [Burkholderiales bacterium]|nr:glutamate--cysteine ligase [Burkholderiales bacterium]